MSEGDGAGTTVYSTDGIVEYTPTQGETDYTSFILIAKKSGCIPVSITVITTNSAVPGTVDAAKINGVSASSVTAINANLGTTQPLNFTGTAGSALVQSDALKIGGTTQTGLDLGANWTAARAAHLDADITSRMATFSLPTNFSSLSITSGGVVKANDSAGAALSTSAQVVNLQNNTFIGTNIPQVLERPDSSSVTVQIVVTIADETGAAVNIDSSANPTVTLVNNAGTDLSSRLGSWSNPATGKYVANYTNTSTDAIEDLHWDISGTVNTKLRRWVGMTQIVDTTAIDFTSSDRTALNGLVTTLGTPAGASIAADLVEIEAETDGIASIPTSTVSLSHFDSVIGTPAGASVSADILEANADLDELITTIGAAGAGLTALGAVTLASSQPNYAPSKVGDAMTLTSGERNSIATAALDLANGIETSLTLRQAIRLVVAAAAGKLSGAATTTIIIRNAVADSKDRITATVDGDGNRSAITVDLS